LFMCMLDGKTAKPMLLSILALCLLSTFLFMLTSTSVSFVKAEPDYTYYGVVPAKLWRYNLTDENDRNSGWRPAGNASTAWLLAIAASEENTNVAVYNLTYSQLISNAQLNSMQKHFVPLRNGTMFKVTSNRPVCVLLLSYGSAPLANVTVGPVPRTFYPAVDGAYVGKEFVFMASTDLSRAFTIFALEQADVTVTPDNGTSRSFPLSPNAYEKMLLDSWHVYKIESTGYILLQSGDPGGIDWINHFGFALPSAKGGFVGEAFYSASEETVDFAEGCGFRVSAVEDTEVTVYHLLTRQVLYQLSVRGGSGVGFQTMAPAIAVQSNNPVTVTFIHNGSLEQSREGGIYGSYGAGNIFIGVKPGENTPIYLPMDSFIEAYIFVNEDAEVTVNGIPRSIAAGSFFLLTQPGTYIISSNKKAVIQILNWPCEPEFQGLEYPGTAIPCVETVDVTHNVTLTPLGEAFPIMYVAIGITVVAAAAVAVLLLRRR
jgi:hypothetical protein